MFSIHQVTQPTDALISALVTLLIDCVDGGASLGFLAPLSESAAARYWAGVFAAVGEEIILWVAEEDGHIVGSVQLGLAQKENARHRAEVMKLLVLHSQRGRGLAAQLMAALEAYARQNQRTLLVLDTEAASVAERVYQKLDWTRLGEIPDYAKNPGGVLRPTAYYYKLITTAASDN